MRKWGFERNSPKVRCEYAEKSYIEKAVNVKTLRLSTAKHDKAKSGSFGAYIQLSPKRGVKVFSGERSIQYTFKTRLEVENDAPYYELVNGEFQCAVKAYAKLGKIMPKPLEIVSVKIGSNWYLGIIMTHVVGKTLGAMLDAELTRQGTDYESEDLWSLEDFQSYFENDEKLTDLIGRYMDLLADARDKGVSYRDDHPWNVIVNPKTKRLSLIDFNPKFVDFPDTDTDQVLSDCFA